MATSDIESTSKKLTQEQLLPATVAGISRSSKWMADGRESLVLKVLVIGDPCVGKTSYVQRYVNGTFHRNYKGTIGVDFALKIIKWGDGGTVKIQLWDIAGQERYTSMTRVYYRDAHGCIVMFDVTSRSSFLNVVKWKRDFDSKCVTADNSPVPCLLIANKCDSENIQTVHEEEIEKLCNEFNFIAWAEVSVKENKMVADTMRYLVGRILTQEKTSSMDNMTGSVGSARNDGSDQYGSAIRLGYAETSRDKQSKCARC